MIQYKKFMVGFYILVPMFKVVVGTMIVSNCYIYLIYIYI